MELGPEDVSLLEIEVSSFQRVLCTEFFLVDSSHVVDYCSLANVTVDQIHTNPANTLESSSSSEDSYIMSGAEWTVAVAGEEHAFLVTVQGSAVTSGKQGSSESSYIFVVKSE